MYLSTFGQVLAWCFRGDRELFLLCTSHPSCRPSLEVPQIYTYLLLEYHPFMSVCAKLPSAVSLYLSMSFLSLFMKYGYITVAVLFVSG